MIKVPGYHLNELLDEPNGDRFVFGGFRKSDMLPVRIEFFKLPSSFSIEIDKFMQEYKIIKEAELDEIAKIHDVININSGIVLISDDYSGVGLNRILLKRKNDLEKFIDIALQLASTLEKLHNKGIIHKYINPFNIFLNEETGKIKIVNLGINYIYTNNNRTYKPEYLFYISPEQTGRVDQLIDHRTDLYSLGITLYELLTGRPPFTSDNHLELIHEHIAKKPMPPNKLNNNIPLVISNIILKLISKNVDDRYQSAFSLKEDLLECLAQLITKNEIKNFAIGRNDIYGKFKISDKLYGREREKQILLEVFERANKGEFQAILISGLPGVGKTAFVNSMQKAFLLEKGCFVWSKYDQLKTSIPYYGLVKALQDLFRQILTESETNIKKWKDRIINELGNDIQTALSIIPELELIIGKSTISSITSITKQDGKFEDVFKKIVRIYTIEKSSLTIFLDHLQWADFASLNLLANLQSDPTIERLLLIGAYRSNEVDNSPNYARFLADFRERKTHINEIKLDCLELRHVKQLISDTLNTKIDLLEPLSKIVFEKTQGNPFFVKQFLQSLYRNNYIKFDIQKGWQYDVKKIGRIAVSENVADLMIDRIKDLPSETQELLKIASCIGTSFNLSLLAKVIAINQEEIFRSLANAVEDGHILFEKSKYVFIHNRIKDAAYSMLKKGQRKDLHLKIAKKMLEININELLDENIFDITNQFNLAIELIKEQKEKYELAMLNLRAGKKAKNTGAYDAALKYLTTATNLLTEKSWANNYDITISIYLEKAEIEYINTNYTKAKETFEIILANAKTVLDKVRAYKSIIVYYERQMKFKEAIDFGLKALEYFNINFASTDTNTVVDCIVKLKDEFQGGKAEKLLEKRYMEEKINAALAIMSSILVPCWVLKPDLLELIVIKMTELTLEYGISPFSSLGLIFYAAYAYAYTGDINTSYEIGETALKIQAKAGDKSVIAKVYFTFAVGIHWRMNHAREGIHFFKIAYEQGVKNGDFQYASYSVNHICLRHFLLGDKLPDVLQLYSEYNDAMHKLKQDDSLAFYYLTRQFIVNLAGKNENKSLLVGEYFNEQAVLPYWYKCNYYSAIALYHFAKITLLCILGKYTEALHEGEKGELYIKSNFGQMQVNEFYFFYALSLLKVSMMSKTNNAEKSVYLKKASEILQDVESWAKQTPENFKHKHLLLSAELMNANNDIKAAELYDEAIKSAKENNYTYIEAIAYECAGCFYASRNFETIARIYLTEAYNKYLNWGALAKLDDPIFKDIFIKNNLANESLSQTIEVETVVKASQIISEEIVIERLLEKLMKTVVTNAGAQKGYLIINKDNDLFIEAKYTISNDEIVVLQSIPIEKCKEISIAIVNFVKRSKENVVLNDAQYENLFVNDAYIMKFNPKSILCIPIIKQNKLIAILYLENNLAKNAFTQERLEILRLLSSQIAVSLENALIYAEMKELNNELKQEIAERKKIERQLDEQREWLSITLDSIGEAVIATDIEGKIIFSNPVAQELTDYNEQEMIGNQIDEVLRTIQDSTQETYNIPYKKSIQDRLTLSIPTNISLISRNGIKRCISGSCAPIKDKQNNTIGNVIVFRDITVDKKTEQELLRVKKIESIGVLAGGIAHDFNNILTVIMGNICLAKMKMEKSSKEKVIELLGKTEKATYQAKNLTQQLLTFSKGGLPIKKTSSISELIKESVIFILRGKKTGYKFLLPDDLWAAEVDEGQFNQVIYNLVINAIQAMPNGGLIEIRGENLEINNEHNFPVKQGSYIKISITDNGSGIPAEIIQNIFDPYYTTKQQGSGLGLAISHSIISNHGGHITVESEVEKGTTFSIYLPATPKKVINEKPEDYKLNYGKGKILVLDDEPAIRDLVKDMLESLGYQVDLAKDGQETIRKYRLAKESNCTYDAVIMDLVIPGGLGGKEAIKELLKIDPQVKAIISSGYSSNSDIAYYEQYGFKGIVPKPYRLEEISKILKLVIEN